MNMKTYICDYAAISPDTMVDAIEYAFPHASVIWKDKDEDSFEVTVIGVPGEMMDELDDVLAPYLLIDPSDKWWED